MADAAGATPIDATWLHEHPLPQHGEGTDKNSRGHVIALGGSRQVPGGLLLTGEAALRAGAGKVQLATIESSAIGLGIALPEAGVIALGETADGEIDDGGASMLAESVGRCDSLVVGPAMTSSDACGALLGTILEMLDRQALVVDAVALHSTRARSSALSFLKGPLVLTPNPDEVASLLDCDDKQVNDDLAGCARKVAERFGAIAVCKASETFIASPDGTLLHYPDGGVGLATGGSGDVLAGIVAALLARGADPVPAAAWSVWLHGEAGRRLADTGGPIGFLARELLPLVPVMMREAVN